MPQVFVWSRSAGSGGGIALGRGLRARRVARERASVAQFLANWRHATLRAGEPVDLAEFLDREDGTAGDDVLVRRLTYTLLRRLERERRAIVGPTRKPADRLREDVIRSPKLQKVIADMAGEGAAEREVMTARAMAMLREMQAALDMKAIAALDQLVQQASSRMFSAVEVDQAGIERLRELAKEGTLVLLPSHKSHMDYVLLAWILYRHKLPMPVIAAGDNLNFFPVGPIFRRAGAFFIRRKFSGDRLYSAVVDAYVRRLLKDGSPLEFFLEGGRSRTGKLLPPKLGLLSLVVDAALGVPTRTTWFCPISIGYERFVEEKAFVRELTGGEKQKENVRGFVKSFDALVGRYGRLSVQFGKPLSLADVLREIDDKSQEKDLIALSPPRRRAIITRLAYRVMNEINAVTAVTPGSLVATSLLAHDKRGLPHAEPRRHLPATRAHAAPARRPLQPVARRRRALAGRSRRDPHDRARRGDRSLRPRRARRGAPRRRRRHLRGAARGAPVARPREERHHPLLRPAGAHRDGAAGQPRAAPRPRGRARPRPLAVAPLQVRVHVPRRRAVRAHLREEIAALEEEGEIARVVLKPSDGAMGILPKGDDGREQVALYARLVENSIEGYRVAARGLAALLRGPLPPKDLVKRAMTLGERMFLAGEVARREAVSRPLLENAYASFVDLGLPRPRRRQARADPVVRDGERRRDHRGAHRRRRPRQVA